MKSEITAVLLNRCDFTNSMFVHKVSSIVLLAMLAWKYYSLAPVTVLTYSNQTKYYVLEPQETEINKILLENIHEQLFDIKYFSFLLNPEPCQYYDEGLFLIVIVSSNPNNYEKRMAIRLTWGQSNDSVKLVFLLGESENMNTTARIQIEAQEYSDIVKGVLIIYSKDVVPRLLNAALSKPYFWIDDVYVSGILAEEIEVPRQPLVYDILDKKQVDKLVKEGVKAVDRFILGPIELKPQNITEMWKSIV